MMSIHLDIDMLRCFMAVAHAASFTKAGQKIGLTQSGVSIKIKRLEERIDAVVFDRTSKTLSLTLEGELLMGYARRILSYHDEAVHRLCSSNASGSLRVGLAEYFLPGLLPTVLNRFRQHYPEIHLEVQTGFGMNLMPLYKRGDLDLIVVGQDSHPGASRVVVREALVWVVGREYDPPESGVIPLALLPAPCGFRREALLALEKTGREWEVSFTGTSVFSVLSAVQAGMGVTVLPMGVLNSTVRQLPLEYGFPDLPMHTLSLFTNDEQSFPAKELFVDYLELELSKR